MSRSLRHLTVGLLALSAGAAVPIIAVAADAPPKQAAAAAKAKAKGKPAAAKGRLSQTAMTERPTIRTRRLITRCTRARRNRVRVQITTTYKGGRKVVTRIRCNGRITTTATRPKAVKLPTVTVNVPIGVPVPVPVPGPTRDVPGPTETVTTPGQTVTVPPPPPAPRPFRLTLLHNNDGESKLLTGDSLTNVGGAARYATKIQEIRDDAASFTDAAITAGTKGKGTINVSSGDNFLAGLNYQGSLAAGTFYDSFPLNRIGYDAITIGNHEFDFGPDRLADFVEDTSPSIPFVSANLGFANEPRLKALADSGRIKPSTLVERDGTKIGIIGLTTPLLRSISTPEDTTINDQLATVVNAERARLEAQGAKIIVLSSHLQGLASERALIPTLRGVDIVIAGGGDELLINAGQRKVNGDPAFAPYPDTSAPDADGRPIPIVTTQGEYRYVGRLTGEFDVNGELLSLDPARTGPVRVVAPGFNEPGTGGTGQPPAVPATDTTERNPTLVRQVDTPLMAFLAAFRARVIARSEVFLDGRNPDPIRRRESNLGNLIADGFLQAGRRDATAAGRTAPDVAFGNGGGIRNSIGTCGFTPSMATPSFNVTIADTFAVSPFGNQISRVTITAAKLKELLEHGFASLPSGNGRFPQIAGMRVEVDYTGTPQVSTAAGVTVPGTRVRELRLVDAAGTPGDTLVTAGAVANPTRMLTLMTTNFTAAGGDGYPFNATTSVPLANAKTDQQALADYLTAPTADGGLGGLDAMGTVTAGPHVTAARYAFGAAPQRMILRNGALMDTAYPGC